MEDRLGPLSEFHSLRFRTKWVGRFAVPNFRLALQVEERRWEDDGGPVERWKDRKVALIGMSI